MQQRCCCEFFSAADYDAIALEFVSAYFEVYHVDDFL